MSRRRGDIESKLLQRESFWIHRLNKRSPLGLNKEFHLKTIFIVSMSKLCFFFLFIHGVTGFLWSVLKWVEQWDCMMMFLTRVETRDSERKALYKLTNLVVRFSTLSGRQISEAIDFAGLYCAYPIYTAGFFTGPSQVKCHKMGFTEYLSNRHFNTMWWMFMYLKKLNISLPTLGQNNRATFESGYQPFCIIKPWGWQTLLLNSYWVCMHLLQACADEAWWAAYQ